LGAGVDHQHVEGFGFKEILVGEVLFFLAAEVPEVGEEFGSVVFSGYFVGLGAYWASQ
jgi:hypothetical protein